MAVLNALQGFCVIGVIILAGWLVSYLKVGDQQTEDVMHRLSYYVATPCLMFSLLSNESLSRVASPSLAVAFLSALAVGMLFALLARFVFHLKASSAIVGMLVAMFMNSNNIGLPVATYILGDATASIPIILMQQITFIPVALTALDLTTSGQVSLKRIAIQPLRQPILAGAALGIAVSAVNDATGHFIVPSFLFDPIEMIGNTAIPLILMSFGMSLRGTKPFRDRQLIAPTITASVCKNLVMPLVALALACAFGLDCTALYACVVLAALPTAQNVYNFAALYNASPLLARDGILLTTMVSPIVILLIAALLGN